MFFFPLTATIVRISDPPSETIAPTAAYSAQKELGAEPLTSMFTPWKILLSLVLSTAATEVRSDLLFLASPKAWSINN